LLILCSWTFEARDPSIGSEISISSMVFLLSTV
jgi:hypothetical protein